MREGWTYRQIGEIAEITDYVANGSFASLRENVSYKSEKDYAILVRLADFSNGFDATKFVYVDEHAYNFLAKSKLHGGEIIMSNVGSIGKLFICPDLGMPMSLAPNTIVIKTSYNPFYAYLFASSHCQAQIKSISSQTALPKFNKTTFKKLTIPVPPIQEQEKIVAELDCLTGIIDKKKQQLEELDNLAQSIFYDMFGDPKQNEKEWKTLLFKDACDSIGDGLHGTPIYDANGKIAFINGNNLIDGKIVLTSKTLFVNEEEAKRIRVPLTKRTVLLSINGTLGKVAIYNEEPVVLGKSACYCTLKPVLLPKFVYGLMCSSSFQLFLEENSSKSTIKNVGLKAIRSFRIICPPHVLQNTYAQKIEAIDKQKELIKRSIMETETLFNSRMDYWFN